MADKITIPERANKPSKSRANLNKLKKTEKKSFKNKIFSFFNGGDVEKDKNGKKWQILELSRQIHGTEGYSHIKVEKLDKSAERMMVFLIFNVILTLVVGMLAGGGVWYYLEKVNPAGVQRIVNKEITEIKTVEQSSALSKVATESVESVVSVVTYQGKVQIGAGSGFIVNARGYIVTNKHVVDGGDSWKVILNNGSKIDVEKEWRDKSLDLAILKIKPGNQTLKPLLFGVSDDVKLGQTAIAIGNSLGQFSNTVSSGIISGLSRNIVASGHIGGAQERLENIFQTDASINSGNSGGPLLDIGGRVVAVNVAKSTTGQNIGFAIPVDVVKPILKSVINDKKIARPYIGVQYYAVYPDLAIDNKLGANHGAWLKTLNGKNPIIKNSPADRAGLKAGDIILEFNGVKIDDKNSLAFMVRKHSVGDVVKLKVLRESKEINVNMKLGEF